MQPDRCRTDCLSPPVPECGIAPCAEDGGVTIFSPTHDGSVRQQRERPRS